MDENALHPALAGFPAVVTLPVQWGDQDAFGHVNNTVALRWFESSRVAFLERSGLAHYMRPGRDPRAPPLGQESAHDGCQSPDDERPGPGRHIGPVVATIICHYRRPIVYPDTVQVGTRLVQLARASMTLGHVVCSLAQKAPVADGESVVVFYDFDVQRPRRVPEDVRRRLAGWQPAEGG
jgi:acyl-CoA thioester hydrolase